MDTHLIQLPKYIHVMDSFVVTIKSSYIFHSKTNLLKGVHSKMAGFFLFANKKIIQR